MTNFNKDNNDKEYLYHRVPNETTRQTVERNYYKYVEPKTIRPGYNETSITSEPWKTLFDMSSNYRDKEVLHHLSNRKKDMERDNTINNDNYYHRLGMCELAQRGAPYAISALKAGEFKEVYDFLKKTIQGSNIIDTIKDSYKDMHNNLEGLDYGLKNPTADCKEWLKDLDIDTNKWRKK